MKLLIKIQTAVLLCAPSCPASAYSVDYRTISDVASKTGAVQQNVRA